MSQSLFSPTWYKVASLTPIIQPQLQVKRHNYHKQTWFVYHDPLTGKNHRFSPVAHKFIMAMDGTTSIDKLWEQQNNELGDNAPTQDEVIRFIAQLFNAGILKGDITPDASSLFHHFKQQERGKWKKRLWNPLAIRIPFVDPEQFLLNWTPRLSWLFSWQVFSLWLVVVLSALLGAVEHWPELRSSELQSLISPINLAVLWLIYPVIKLFHELGHAITTKHYGGEVHEIGILLLAFIPMPYVDASNAAAFPQRRHRMLVSAMGIMVELFIASLALFIWLQVEDGIVRDICFNIMVIAGISTLLFNGNPLLRYDAYYVLADFLDIPNLATRANKYIAYLVQYYGFGLHHVENPANSGYEKSWFVAYAILSFCYRMFIVFALALYISGEYFFIGVALASWFLATQIIFPFGKGIYQLYKTQQSLTKRNRVLVASAGFSGLFILVLFVLPVPFASVHQGVVWVNEDAQVRSAADGTIDKLLVTHHSQVNFGQELIKTSDPFISSEVKHVQARLEQLQAQHQSQRLNDRVQTAIIEDSIRTFQEDLKLAREKEQNLMVTSHASGTIIIPERHDLEGRFVRKGELLAYILGKQNATVRVLIPQTDISLLNRIKKVDVRLANQLDQPVHAEIKRVIPAAKSNLPSAVLGHLGGGNIDIDPNDPKGLKTLNSYFQVDVTLPFNEDETFLGTRAYVRFNFGSESLSQQWYRSLRQLFLRHFNV